MNATTLSRPRKLPVGAIVAGVLAVLGAALAWKADRILLAFDPPGYGVVLVQYTEMMGKPGSTAAGHFGTFEECEKARERLPAAGGLVLGGVCVREAQWKEVSRSGRH